MNPEYRISNLECRNSKFQVRFSFFASVLICSCLLVGSTGGCQNNKNTLAEQVVALKHEKIQLAHQLEKAKAAGEQAKSQIQVLSGLSPQVRLENLYDLRKIRITRYTNLYDKDNNGRYEELIVYIKPFDAEGDIIKASGAVDVELWDLNAEDAQALLGRWHLDPAELKTMWFATLITINYRLVFDVSEIIDKFDRPLTVKVTFTDYLSGRVFTEQKVIKPSN